MKNVCYDKLFPEHVLVYKLFLYLVYKPKLLFNWVCKTVFEWTSMLPFFRIFKQGEFIASAKSLQLEVFFFRKQKAHRLGCCVTNWAIITVWLIVFFFFFLPIVRGMMSIFWCGCRFFLKEDNKKGARNIFTCVACHPKDDCIATGHADGKIRLWLV